MAQTHYFPNDEVHFTWDTAHEPVITIADGDTVVIETRDVSDNQIGPDSDASAIDGLNWDRVYPLAGPIQVEGAAAGDTLAVEILDLRTRGWGWTAVLPGLGLLPEEFPRTPTCASSTSRAASTPTSTTSPRSRSRRSSARWASARPAPPRWR